MPTINLLSTFIAEMSPNTNFSTPAVIYVGTVPSLGANTGLLQLPILPVCPVGTLLTSAVLRLKVYTISGPSPSTVNIQKVTAPSPLDTTTATYNTVTVDPTVQTTKTIAAADIGSTVDIDITSLIISWFTTPFPGIAITCTDGTYVLFDSFNSANPPQLILTCGGTPPIPPIEVNSTTVGRLVDTNSETVPALPGADQFSTAQDISEKTQVTFFFTNQGAVNASVGVEESIDGVIYTAHPQTTVSPGITGVLSPGYYAKYARLYFHSVDPILPTALLISYIAQT